MLPVVADADTLFGATTRGLLIHLDYQGLISLHWSALILDEMSRALIDTGRKQDAASAGRHEQLMRAALPQAEIPTQQVQAQFASVATAMRSAKNTHVAVCARAILAGDFYPGTQVVSLVTKNIRDFGVRKLATLGIEVQRPDAFLLDQFQQAPETVASAFAARRATLHSAPEPEQTRCTLQVEVGFGEIATPPSRGRYAAASLSTKVQPQINVHWALITLLPCRCWIYLPITCANLSTIETRNRRRPI